MTFCHLFSLLKDFKISLSLIWLIRFQLLDYLTLYFSFMQGSASFKPFAAAVWPSFNNVLWCSDIPVYPISRFWYKNDNDLIANSNFYQLILFLLTKTTALTNNNL